MRWWRRPNARSCSGEPSNEQRAPRRRLRSPCSAGCSARILLIAAWEGAARGFQLPSYTLPAISDILASTFEKRKLLMDAALYTVSEAVLGYALGCVIGIALAILDHHGAAHPRLRAAGRDRNQFGAGGRPIRR